MAEAEGSSTFSGLFSGSDDELAWLERYLMLIIAADDELDLRRLSLFILAHAAVDRALIMALGFGKAQRLRVADRDPRWLDEVIEAFSSAASRTFMAHLNEAVDKGLVTEAGRATAADLNKARDDFLHWMPERPSRPVYRGVDVTTHEGLRACLLDVKRFLETEGIAGDDNSVTRRLDELGNEGRV